jgi:excisionase family DNA binding protein
MILRKHRESLLGAEKLGIRDAAKMLGIGNTKLREIIQKGDIPVLRIDGKCLLLTMDLEAYLDGCYGRTSRVKNVPVKSRALPDRIANSELLRPRRR